MRYSKYSGRRNFFSLPNEVFLLSKCRRVICVQFSETV